MTQNDDVRHWNGSLKDADRRHRDAVDAFERELLDEVDDRTAASPLELVAVWLTLGVLCLFFWYVVILWVTS